MSDKPGLEKPAALAQSTPAQQEQPQQPANKAIKPVIDNRPAAVKNLENMLVTSFKSIQSVAAKSIDPARLARIVVILAQQNPKILECTPESILGCCLNSAISGLELGGNHGYAFMVPYKTKNGMAAQFQIGWAGYVKLAMQSGSVKDLQAEAVHKNDEFSYEYGTNKHLMHRPCNGDRGEVTHYYSCVTYMNGGSHFKVMSKQDMHSHAMRYSVPFKNGWDTPWKTAFDAMACKTMIRLIRQYLPMSETMQRIVDTDEQVAESVDLNTGFIQPAEIIDETTGEVKQAN